MTHPRTTIRNAIVTTLAGITFNGIPVSVEANRNLPFWNEEIPTIAVYVLSETADAKETAWREYHRVLSVSIEIMLGEIRDDIDDVADPVSLQVEEKMFIDPWLGESVVEDSLYTGMGMAYSKRGDVEYASLVMQFDVKYRTDAPGAQPLDDFDRHKTEIDVNADSNSQINAKVEL